MVFFFANRLLFLCGKEELDESGILHLGILRRFVLIGFFLKGGFWIEMSFVLAVLDFFDMCFSAGGLDVDLSRGSIW